jgi:hypothetical protein
MQKSGSAANQSKKTEVSVANKRFNLYTRERIVRKGHES